MAHTGVNEQIHVLSELPPDYQPDWSRERMVILREGVPDRVPFLEAGLDRSHKRRVLGRSVKSLADDLEVSTRLGQAFVTISLGLHNSPAVSSAMATTHVEGWELDREGQMGWMHAHERRWAHGTALRSEEDLERFPWPDADELDLSLLDEADRLLPEHNKVILAVGKIFNLAWWLMGFDHFSYALADNPALVKEIYARIAAYQSRVVERALDHGSLGLVWHADDIAYRTGLMVAPKYLRDWIFPVYRQLNRECHLKGIPTLFHSDGDVGGMMEDIIDAGFDAFNPIEPLAMDIRELKKRVDGRITLIGNVDLAYTLTRGTPAEVDDEVRGLMRDVAPGGGYALASANSVPDYVPWANFVAMHAAWVKYGRYPISV